MAGHTDDHRETIIPHHYHVAGYKNVTSGVLTRFSFDLAKWPSFWSQWPSFKLDQEITQANILSKIHDDNIKNVTSRILTKLSFDLAQWSNFLHQVTQFQSLHRNHRNILSKINIMITLWKYMTSGVLMSFPLIWPGDLVFDTTWPCFRTLPRNHQDKHFEQD